MTTKSSTGTTARGGGLGPRLWRAAPLCLCLCLCLLATRGCRNDPWPSAWSGSDTYYTSYTAEIKTLDPAVTYYHHEGVILESIVEMPLGYDYLRRPYELKPMLLDRMPEVTWLDAAGRALPDDAPAAEVARGEVLLTLREGVRFQPHPCFARDADGRNPNLSEGVLGRAGLSRPGDFPHQSTRELRADDLRTALTRLCDRRLASPVFSNLSSFVEGMPACSEAIAAEVARLESLPENAGRDRELYPVCVDYGRIPFAGAEVLDGRRLRLRLSRKYPQFRYWLAMHFFSPVPQEALEFYSHPRIADRGLQLRLWPVGTGAYRMAECLPHERIVLERNPAYRDVRYPAQGAPGDREAGLLDDAGQRLPLTGRIVFNFEREPLPIWMKFQQGYYDDNGIPADMLDASVTVDASGDIGLGDEFAARGVCMVKSVQATTYYVAFNLLDATVGGLSERQCKLRQAISIALDFHEYVDIFSNGRDIAAQSIIPPGAGISGSCDLNPFTDETDPQTGRPRRLPLSRARRLLAEAGYPGGVGPDGRPLTLHFDDSSSGSGWKTRHQWLRARLEPLGIVLESRVTDSNRLRDKLSRGDWQLMMRAWVADYPDPENFLFLFYGPNATVANGGHGMNYSNYASETFDALFRRLETMPDGPERARLLAEANRVLQHDAPYVFAYHRRDLLLVHRWLRNYKPHTMANTFLQFLRVRGAEREAARREWNPPLVWPVRLALVFAFGAAIAAALRPQGRG